MMRTRDRCVMWVWRSAPWRTRTHAEHGSFDRCHRLVSVRVNGRGYCAGCAPTARMALQDPAKETFRVNESDIPMNLGKKLGLQSSSG